jgi:hypothetical protein
VELTCEYPGGSLPLTLGFNLLLMTASAVLAFKTRKLPDNFNESRFISLCLVNTLCILLSFIPAYLTSPTKIRQMVVMGVVLQLHHTVALVFLFLPKMYAVRYRQADTSYFGGTEHKGDRPGLRAHEVSVKEDPPLADHATYMEMCQKSKEKYSIQQ